METLEQIKSRVGSVIPGARLEIIPNDSPSGHRSLLGSADHALAVARLLHDDPQLRLDYASNVTGVDWLGTVLKEKVKVKKVAAGVEKEVEEVVEKTRPGYLEAVYHLYSIQSPGAKLPTTSQRRCRRRASQRPPRSRDGAAASLDPRRLSDGYCARW